MRFERVRRRHGSALKYTGSVAAYTHDDQLVEDAVLFALPEAYDGDTLNEVPGMITSARRKFLGPRRQLNETPTGFAMRGRLPLLEANETFSLVSGRLTPNLSRR